MDYFKRTLNELRESAGFNQTELADILEVSPKTLWLYEQDSTNMPDELIKKYMYLFDIPYEDIFFGPKYEKFVQVKERVRERASVLKKIVS
ncbi:transcriptional regulator [Bacillus thuringiensis serovar brasilensis]|uniref:helix-turn-helix transcriptional regulator n=1 Tax=Bacillus cereus group TaxID=86661 RepID=UPI000A39B23A|nr:MULTISPECIES: helix-turn-helix transcriptional regulator [Bacillus cereus group]MCU5028548.1 helix-turn-helix domain-containing protein [Bacillus cereus]MRA71953.1 helix-turn-helix domain-containing protein [Bacillus thuringiensis]MBJ7946781.1 helix-turn-helix transcriptional regulator [Bacillus cereus group sp. N24]MRA91163.1 helix-turn-helix domain-containing protein [Bacillus thuringiensis]MRC53380.1 helix-turn-helix domain-containing protein [Bacillus thuringiensis]